MSKVTEAKDKMEICLLGKVEGDSSDKEQRQGQQGLFCWSHSLNRICRPRGVASP